jgi:hypothetical protein
VHHKEHVVCLESGVNLHGGTPGPWLGSDYGHVQQVQAGVTYIEHTVSQAVLKRLQWNTETACTAFERNTVEPLITDTLINEHLQ